MITVNGTEARLPVGARIADVLDALGVEPGRRGVAIAIDGEVVPRYAMGHDEPAGGRTRRGRPGDPGRLRTLRRRSAVGLGGFEP